MKSAFKISLLANALLAALVCCLAAHSRLINSPAVPLISPDVVTPPASEPPHSQPRPFHWSQLESSDYRIYIAKLRAIGCPPQTLRDIISADVDTLYTKKRKELHLDDASAAAGPWSRPEETALIAKLLGDRPAPQPAPQPQQELARAQMPLVFQNLDLDALMLQEGQREGIEELRQMFLAELGGTNQDPNDPAYYERWKKAQSDVDSMLPGMIGGEAFMKMQAASDGPEPQSTQSP
jgi:hypothetical protein